VLTVVDEFNWLPFDVYRLYLDAQDSLGLVYWKLIADDRFWKRLSEDQQKIFKAGLSRKALEDWMEDRNRNEILPDASDPWFLK
jgi:hypothetical protein